MRHINWLYALLGMTSGIALGRHLTHHAEIEPFQSPQLPISQPERDQKLTIEDLLNMIEENGGAEGLDLSGRDLSWLDLSSQALEAILEQQDVDKNHNYPAWISSVTWGRTLIGLNLYAANLQGANLQRANLYGVDLSSANLQSADLRDACLQSVNLYGADLRKARLWRADLRRATADAANFEKASLYRVKCETTSMFNANLTDAFLESANLSEVKVSRKSIGDRILQEKPEAYGEYLLWDDPNLTQEEWDKFFIHRLARTRAIYLELMNGFLKHGYHDDASWAHFKQRALERQMHGLCQTRRYYGDELPADASFRSRKWWQFYMKHTVRWILLWGAELSCGYGEKPLRAIWWTLGTIFIFPLFYWLSGGLASTTGATMNWLDYLNYSFGAFTTMGFARFV